MKYYAQQSLATPAVRRSASVLVVYADNGTPLAVFSDVGDAVAMRTADNPGFGDTLRLLGLQDAAPVIESHTTRE